MLPRVGAIDARRVGQVGGDRQEELADEESTERPAEESPDPQRQVRADPVAAVAERPGQISVEDEVRDQHHLERDDQGRQDQGEEDSLAAELQHGEGVGSHRAGDQLADRRHARR